MLKFNEIKPINQPPTPRSYMYSILYENQLYTFGGYNKSLPEIYFNDLHKFDLDKHEWQLIETSDEDKPSPRCGHRAVLFHNKMIIFGGYDNSWFNTFYEFNIKKKAWKKIKLDFTSFVIDPRVYHCSVCIRDKMFIFGGAKSTTDFNDLFELDLRSNSLKLIKSKTPPPSPRSYHSAVAFGNKMYVYGGRDHQDISLNELYSYDIIENEWSSPLYTTGDVPLGRDHHSASVYHTYMYIFGGNTNADRFVSTLFRLNLITLEWQKIITSNPPIERWAHNAIVYNHNLYIWGGDLLVGETTYFNDIHSIPIHTNTLLIDLEKMFQQELFANIEVMTKDGKLFKIHECIIKARVPQLTKTLISVINEFESKIVEIILHYIYTGLLNRINEIMNHEKTVQKVLLLATELKLNNLIKFIQKSEFDIGEHNANMQMLITDTSTFDVQIKIPKKSDDHVQRLYSSYSVQEDEKFWIFNAHKCILTARSKFYADLFQKNASQSEFVDEQTDFFTFKNLLDFFYLGNLDNIVDYGVARNLNNLDRVYQYTYNPFVQHMDFLIQKLKRKSIKSWNQIDVSNWLRSLGKDSLVPIFEFHEIVGEHLPLLTSEVLQQELEVRSLQDAVLIIQEILKYSEDDL
ncbi:hypothetical protein M0811_13352 [Anaeramoeba ignava]|uniref:BTB domain-containing protein n=1 Tax=Anaeramoeba ignava TaxID=1746090 RepID=A0A9Q0R4A0_ANAIG|nr:hypothetical protein M0811_13352 [Anaeramoeba ignava]